MNCKLGQNLTTFYAKNGHFWPFYLFSHSIVTKNLLRLQNIKYDHIEPYLYSWSAQRCHKWLKNSKNGPKMAKTGCLWPFISTTTITTTAKCIIHITIHHCENTDATRPCPEGVSEQQSEPLDSEDKV